MYLDSWRWGKKRLDEGGKSTLLGHKKTDLIVTILEIEKGHMEI